MKIVIVEACAIAGEETSSHADVGDELDVSKDEAALLTRMGRAMYLDKGDDPTKGTLTATADDKASIKKRVQAIAAERKEREVAAQSQTPTGLAAMVAAAVAQAVQAALKPAEAPKA